MANFCTNQELGSSIVTKTRWMKLKSYERKLSSSISREKSFGQKNECSWFEFILFLVSKSRIAKILWSDKKLRKVAVSHFSQQPYMGKIYPPPHHSWKTTTPHKRKTSGLLHHDDDVVEGLKCIRVQKRGETFDCNKYSYWTKCLLHLLTILNFSPKSIIFSNQSTMNVPNWRRFGFLTRQDYDSR